MTLNHHGMMTLNSHNHHILIMPRSQRPYAMTQIENRKDITVPMDESLVEEIHDELGYGDSRAEWVRRAVRKELDRVKNEDETGGGTDDGEALSSP